MFRVTRDAIINQKNGSDFIFKGLKNNMQGIKSLEGIDYAWVEEAQTITKSSIEILTPTIRKQGSKIIWTYNRLNELDPVHERLIIKGRPNTLIINQNYHVAEKYGWLEDSILAEMEYDRDNNTALYTHKWLGEPISQVDNAIIGRESVLKAMERVVSDEGAIEIGADIARMGNDRTVFKKRKGLRIIDTMVYTKLRTTEVCDKLEMFADYSKTTLIKVDDTGVGGGVTDEMMARGYNVMAINFGARATNPDKYPNLISEAWFYMAEIMDKVQMELDSDLLMELSTRQWVMDNRGRRAVESKDSYKKRGYRSPDMADATILCFYSGNVITLDDISM